MDELAIGIAIVSLLLTIASRSRRDSLLVKLTDLAQEQTSLRNTLEETIAGLTRRVWELERELSRLRSGAGLVDLLDREETASVAASRPGEAGRAPVSILDVAPPPSLVPVAASVAAAAGVPYADELHEVMGVDLAGEPAHRPEPRRPVLAPLIHRIRSTEEWEVLIGGRWMNRIGAFALILGVGFFLKYAISAGWISETLQVAMAMALGVGLLAGARRAHAKSYIIFGQGLVGAGIATLYLAVYAASNFYHLVPTPVALLAMALVTALALSQSLYYDSLAVALLGWAGGFLSLPLLGISGSNEIGVIGYLVLLDAEILAIAFARDRWFILEPLTLGATYVTYIIWYLTSYSGSKMLLAAIALTLFWAMFLSLDVVRIVHRVTTYRGLRHILGAANALLFYGMMFILLNGSRWTIGSVTLAVALVYIFTILLTRRGLREDRLDARYTLTAIVLAVIATPILASGLTVSMLWSVEALALLWCGIHWRLWFIWRPALGLFALTPIALLAAPGALAYDPIADFRPVLNERVLAFVVLAATAALAIRVLRPLRDKYRASYVASLHYGWCALVFVLLTVETNDLFRRAMIGSSQLTHLQLEFTRSLAVAAVWMVYSVPLVRYGLRTRVFPVLSTGLAVVALSVGLGVGVGAVYQPIERFTPVLNARVAILLLLIAGLAIHYAWLRRERATSWLGMVTAGYQAAMILIGFELLTAEIHDFFRHQTGAISEHAAGQSGIFIEIMTLAAVWMLYSFPLVRYGMKNRALTVLLAGLGSVGMATGAGSIAAFALVPSSWLSLALSLRPIILLFLTVGLVLNMRWLRESQWTYRWLDAVLVAMQAATVLLGFELVTAQTRDAVQHQINAATSLVDLDSWQNLQQMAFSVVWLLYAILIMCIGLWRRTRWLRLGAMVLLGFIILKIFLYDLSFLSPAYRSISFAGLGVILLAVSFLYQRYRALLLEAS